MESAAEDHPAGTRCALPQFVLHQRLTYIPLLYFPVFYFRQSFLISDMKMVEMVEVVCRCLDDEVVEVREMAAT